MNFYEPAFALGWVSRSREVKFPGLGMNMVGRQLLRS